MAAFANLQPGTGKKYRRGRYSHRKCAIPIISTMAIAKVFSEVKRGESKFLKSFGVDKPLVFRLMSCKKASSHDLQRVLRRLYELGVQSV
jgi:hypothetical protein